MSARYRMYLWAGSLMVLNWLSLTVIHPRGTVAIGYVLGSLSAQVTLAAAWAVLGPTRLAQRIIVSIGWVFSLWVAMWINMAVHSSPNDIVVVVGVFILGQWLLLQLPLWGLALGLNLQLSHREEADHEAGSVELRFSVRYLFIIMSIAGVLLGVGRVVVPMLSLSGAGETSVFIFLAAAGVVMTFPLLIAALLRRLPLPSALLSLIFVGAATVGEIPLFQQLGGIGPNPEHFVAINTCSAIVVLLIAATVRLNGFFLRRKPKCTGV